MVKFSQILIVAGLLMLLSGLLLHWAERIPFLSWMGRLPGDIRIQRERITFYFPIVTCLVLSVVLTTAFRVLRMALSR